MQTPFIEENCTVSHEGRQFTAGGSYLWPCKDGHMRGVVYAKPDKAAVTTWHGEHIANAWFGPVYRGNFCKMRAVSFTLGGVRYTGRYCPDWADAVRVRSTKRVAIVAESEAKP